MNRSLLLIFLCACSQDRLTALPKGDAGGVKPETDSGSTPVDAGQTPTDAGVNVDAGQPPVDAGTPPVDCTQIPAVPLDYTTLRGPISAEDFAFDDEGHLVSTDEEGNIVKSTKDGQVRVFVPNAGDEIAGMRYLPSGDLVYARVDDGTIYRVAPSGARSPVLSGFDYPNGVEIGMDGRIYVAEQNAGQVRRVDPDTGAFDLVATGLQNPNGLTFSPDYKILYVGSFGAGTVHAIDFDDAGNASAPRLFAETPNAPGEDGFLDYDAMIQACVGQSAGAACTTPYHTAKGYSPTCQLDFDNTLICYSDEDWPDDVTPCQGQPAGATCTFDFEGSSYTGVCVDDGFGFSYCFSEDFGAGGSGGLDGMAVDACGYVYVTEFVLGVVWRISPDGQQVEQLFNPMTEWVPNMQWGTGVGGWDPLTLYVIDREPDRLYEIPLGIPSKPRAFPRGP